MSEITLKSTNDQSNLDFHLGMVARMETAFHSYGDYTKNYVGTYSNTFRTDVKNAIDPIIEKYKRSGNGNGTTANTNSVVSALERLLLYLVGGRTRGGEVKRGNTEYLMDAANFLMIEYNRPQVPRAKFKASGFDESPGVAGSPEGEAAVAAFQTYGNKQGD
jgi:hypothetical protein